MAISHFYGDYVDGQPPVAVEEVVYFNLEINDIDGYVSADEEIDSSGTQAHVKLEIKSSPEILAALKSDPRLKWINDEDWTP